MTISLASADEESGTDPSGVEFHGVAGSSDDCEAAVTRLLQCGPCITHARIITSGRTHCLLLTTDIGDPIVVKSGFASGYGGAGPNALSRSLQLLHSHGADIDEWIADDALIERIDQSALTLTDMNAINKGCPRRPSRWSDYILERDHERARDGSLWHDLPPVMPFSIIDGRIMDLARDFWSDSDGRLIKGYRRLEDMVRKRTGLSENGAKLFSQAFQNDDAPLTWNVKDKAERQGRANLFGATYMAYRNPRAHNENPATELLAEFLLLNQLFRLEAEAVEVSPR